MTIRHYSAASPTPPTPHWGSPISLKKNGGNTFLILGVLVVLLIGLFAVVNRYYSSLTARHWREQLATIPDERIEAAMAQIADLGEDGLPVLAEALNSPRDLVARRANALLVGWVERSKSLSPLVCEKRFETLSRILADRIEGFSSSARNDAEEIASEMLAWPLENGTQRRGRMLYNCEHVVRTAMRNGGEVVLRAQRANDAAGATNSKNAPLLSPSQKADPSDDSKTVYDVTALPGGGLPVETEPVLYPTENEENLKNAEEADTLKPVEREPPLIRTPNETAPPQRALSNQGDVILQLKREDAQESPEWYEMKTIDLMRRLHTDGGTASQVEKELLRRGLSLVELDLARRLFHPDSEVRLKLVENLSRLKSIDAGPWFMQLCQDENADVRFAAFSRVATASDPTLLKQLQFWAESDADPRIRRYADQLRAFLK